MRAVNTFVLNFTISIIDYLYRGRHFQRFWVLEEIARAPYFAFVSVLHLRESLGLRGPEHLYLMRNILLKHLTKPNIWSIWKVGAVILIGWIAFSPDTLYLSTIGSTWFIIGWLLGLLTISPTK